MDTFSVKPQIYSGASALSQLQALAIERAYIVCDPFLARTHKADRILAPLRESGACVKVYADVSPDPTIGLVSDVTRDMLAFRPDTVIALGGGSAIDTAKAVCQVYAQLAKKKKPRLIAVPTTSGTGSEVTAFAVISDPDAQLKYPLVDDALLPDLALLDPALTQSVPPAVTADTGIDVLTHALEAYTSTKANDFTDACAEKALRLVWGYLARAVADGDDETARARLHSASCLAGMAFNVTSLGLCHAMAHALGARFHLAHGRCNALLLPHVIAYNAGLDHDESDRHALRRYAEIADLLGIGAGTEKASVYLLIRRLKNLMRAVAVPQWITEQGVQQEDYRSAIGGMTEHALEDDCILTNPRRPAAADIVCLYGKLLRGNRL